MKRWFALLVFLVGSTGLLCVRAQAEQHRATRLGNPATRFAPPLAAPEDLRSRFRDEKLKPDFASVLRQWGWQGNLDDLHRAAVTARIDDIKIPIGTVMPFMSSRENGRAICLRNVTWAGAEPAPAYAFQFTSKGRRYRCVTPKACSNFFVEDLGGEPISALALECAAPGETLAGRPVEVCITVRNTGNGPEPKATVRLPIPHGATMTGASEGGVSSETQVTWEIANLAPNSVQKRCAILAVPEPARLVFDATANGSSSKPVQVSCSTKVIGIPAILIDAVDIEDPVEVGKTVTYDVKVTNQGSAPGTNIRLACTLPASEEFVSGGGVTAMKMTAAALVTEPLPSLIPKGEAIWRIVVKATQAGDARLKIELTSDQFQRPILEEESTQLY